MNAYSMHESFENRVVCISTLFYVGMTWVTIEIETWYNDNVMYNMMNYESMMYCKLTIIEI